ncbi:MAG TPA: MFS transporter [Acidimicrobiales bacterium]|nr:MFS transporter [Acidimicrobiales bacterium]
MTRITAELVLDGSSVAALTSPRRGLVLEAVDSSPVMRAEDTGGEGWCASFSQAEGPLASYRRTVDVEPIGGDRYRAHQVVDVKVGLPWWSWLLALPLRFSLGKAVPAGARRGEGSAAPAGAGAGGTGAARWGRPEPGARQDEPLPWWAPPHRLDRRQALLMATLAALVSVQGFLGALLPETLTYAASEMHVGTFGQGAVFAAVELSALPALFALVLADRRGRRSVVLWATGAAALMSELGGFATSISWLTVTQVSAGALVAAGGIAAIVVAVEEVPRGCRAWAVGVLGMAGGFGAGIPLLLLPLAGIGDAGWRWLYFLSLLTLPVVALCARQLPEGRRWQADEVGTGPEVVARPEVGAVPAGKAGVTPATVVTPAAVRSPRGGPSGTGPSGTGPSGTGTLRTDILRTGRGRLLLVCTGAVLFALFATPASLFQTEFLHQQRHYSPFGISVLQQVAGTIGALGVLFGGRLADTHGRRPVAVVSVAGATVATLLAYLAHGWLMWFATTSSQFFLYATAPVLGVYGAELFATRTRARSAGLVAASSSVGGVSGLLAVGALADRLGTLGPALAVMAVGPLLLVALLLVAYPETAGTALEDLAPEAALLLAGPGAPLPASTGRRSARPPSVARPAPGRPSSGGPPGEPCWSQQ